MDSSPITTPSGDEILTCSRPLIERRLRPQHEQALKCPRCESTHTKFCYYNNYSLSQPRYFCKTCRRYWTKGGTLRNIPVGGGCRKNKKVSSNSKKPSSSSTSTDNHNNIINQQNHNNSNNNNNNSNSTDLHLAFPEQLQFSSLHFNGGGNPNFLFENPTPIDFMENKYENLIGGHDGLIMGNGENFGGIMQNPNNNNNFHGNICAPFGLSAFDHGNVNSSTGANIFESCQRFMLPYDQNQIHREVDDVKPNAKILSLEWHEQQQQQACNSDAGKDSFGELEKYKPGSTVLCRRVHAYIRPGEEPRKIHRDTWHYAIGNTNKYANNLQGKVLKQCDEWDWCWKWEDGEYRVWDDRKHVAQLV
ncbi:hypothetical protein DH2020_019287 [Rehmannia glutinosa]|uniref:Dof zinc finger protein n=1 Tax=Rehmannia glutinosa TaxID=99300 RepID=A0ABR0WQE1_REHGL